MDPEETEDAVDMQEDEEHLANHLVFSMTYLGMGQAHQELDPQKQDLPRQGPPTNLLVSPQPVAALDQSSLQVRYPSLDPRRR